MARDNALKFTFSTVYNAWSSVTLNIGTAHTATTPAAAPVNGTVVTFAAIGTAAGGGIAANKPYYVVNASGTSFGISESFNGTPITITTGSGAIAMATYALSQVLTFGGRSGSIKVNTTANTCFSGYSDALNVARFRDQLADVSILTNPSVVSTIVNDAPLNSSTSEGNYYLRASVAVAGMFGPAPCQIAVQGAGVTSPTAPVGGDPDWLQVSNIGNCAPNVTTACLTISTATGGFTVKNGSISQGQTVMPVATAGNLTAGVQYLVGPSSILYTVNGTALSGLTTTTDVIVYVGTFSNVVPFTVATAAINTSLVTLDATPSAGQMLVFTAITGGTGLAANTPYFVLPPSTYGGPIQLSATFNGTPITVTSALTAGAGFATNIAAEPYIYLSNTVTSNVLQCVTALAGSTAAPHGLEVGDVVHIFSGSAAGTPTPAVDQPYYVNSVPSATTFTVSATINGTTATITSATNAVLAVSRNAKLLNVQVDKTIRPWMRVAVSNANTAYAQVGYVNFLFADLSTGRDNSLVN